MVTVLSNEICKFPPVGVSEESGNRSVRKVQIPYGYRTIVNIRECYCGYTAVDDVGRLVRYLPWKDPDDESQFVIRLDHQGYGYGSRVVSEVSDLPMTTAMKPLFWVGTLHTSTFPYPLGTGTFDEINERVVGDTYTDESKRFACKEIRPGREFINPPKGQYYAPGTPRTQISIPIPTMLSYQDLFLTWFQIPIDDDPDLNAFPRSAIEACLGKVNSGPFSVPTIPDGVDFYPAETVHLAGIRIQQIQQANKTRAVNITYEMRYRGGTGIVNGIADQQLNWNTLPASDSGEGGYTRIYRGLTGDTGLFLTADFDNLFRTQMQFSP